VGRKITYPVWVNGERFKGVEKAAEAVGLLSGKKIAASWLLKQMRERGSVKAYGVLISALGPGGNSGEEVAAVKIAPRGKPGGGGLLLYPPGEDVVSRGLCRVQR
jgi:hypothetical protein